MNILIVDDNEQNLYQLQILLGANGYQVASAVNGADALTLARQNPPDLIVSDILMPVLDGFALCREWKKDERMRGIPFIFYTATYTDERDREFALNLGAERFLVKPEDPEIFMQTVQEVIREVRNSAAVPSRTTTPIQEENDYLKQYNTVLIHKMEAKMGELEQANRELEHEIAVRKRAEEDLQLRNILLTTQQESSIDGILAVDEKGRILSFNQRLVEMWNVPANLLEDRLDEPFLQFMTAQMTDRDSFHQRVQSLYQHRQETGRDELKLEDGRVFDRYSAPMFGAGERYYGRVWYFRDITENKRLTEQLLRSQRVESIGTLASGVAHDLNNILSPIMMASSMLGDNMPVETYHRLVATIQKAAQRGADIVKQVLTFARGVEGQKTSLRPQLIVDQIDYILRETFPKSITVTVTLPGDLWKVTGDMTQLHQVLLNLCVNARDSMLPGGGTLVIAAANAEVDNNHAARTQGARPGRYVVMKVIDSGSGIPPQIVDKIFDPFFTTKEPGKGTGLGLSTVMGIVRSHGGFVEVESHPGKGSVFRIFIPAASEKQFDPNPVQRPDLPRGNNETILIVDDEAEILQVITVVLAKHNYRVITARDGIEALTTYVKNPAEIKMVLTDVMMPLMDGVNLTRALKKITPDLLIIAASGSDDTEEFRQTELSGLGVGIFLKKPFTNYQLLEAVHCALNRAT